MDNPIHTCTCSDLFSLSFAQLGWAPRWKLARSYDLLCFRIYLRDRSYLKSYSYQMKMYNSTRFIARCVSDLLGLSFELFRTHPLPRVMRQEVPSLKGVGYADLVLPSTITPGPSFGLPVCRRISLTQANAHSLRYSGYLRCPCDY